MHSYKVCIVVPSTWSWQGVQLGLVSIFILKHLRGVAYALWINLKWISWCARFLEVQLRLPSIVYQSSFMPRPISSLSHTHSTSSVLLQHTQLYILHMSPSHESPAQDWATPPLDALASDPSRGLHMLSMLLSASNKGSKWYPASHIPSWYLGVSSLAKIVVENKNYRTMGEIWMASHLI